jgi:Flp pilus assembly protein TadG
MNSTLRTPASPPDGSRRTIRASPVLDRLRSDRGLGVVGFLILVPVLIMGMELIVVGGRLAAANADVQSAAREAARQASIARNRGSAGALIGPVATTALDDKGFQCESFDVQMGPSTNFVAGGQVQVVVRCRVGLSDIDFLGVPGSVNVERSAVEPIDTYRVVAP